MDADMDLIVREVERLTAPIPEEALERAARAIVDELSGGSDDFDMMPDARRQKFIATARAALAALGAQT
jgi:hypothetical protein